MYAVIFRATIKTLDDEYRETAARLRERAQRDFGCTGFVSVSEGDQELAISYWPTLQHIHAWKHDPQHQAAQQRGKAYWYAAYQVQVVEILREFRHDP